MMDIDKVGAEFEAWAIISAWLGLSEEDMEFFDGGYVNCEAQAAWLGWQASRESLVIHLPFAFDQDLRDQIQECRDAIHAAGVRTK